MQELSTSETVIVKPPLLEQIDLFTHNRITGLYVR